MQRAPMRFHLPEDYRNVPSHRNRLSANILKKGNRKSFHAIESTPLSGWNMINIQCIAATLTIPVTPARYPEGDTSTPPRKGPSSGTLKVNLSSSGRQEKITNRRAPVCTRTTGTASRRGQFALRIKTFSKQRHVMVAMVPCLATVCQRLSPAEAAELILYSRGPDIISAQVVGSVKGTGGWRRGRVAEVVGAHADACFWS